MADQPKIYQLEDFVPHLEKEFILSQEGVDQTLSVTLIEAEALKHALPEGMRQGFSLLFQLPPNLPLEQGIYTIANDDFGTCSLFLTSVQPNETGSLMESIFN